MGEGYNDSDLEKDPAFLMYSKDWLQGTASMSKEEKGTYIDLLCHQHQEGGLPNDIKRLARMTNLSMDEFNDIWVFLQSKFVEIDGKLFNKKLDKVVNNRTKHACMRTIVGTFGGIMRDLPASEFEKKKIRKKFNYRDFIEIYDKDKQKLTILLSKFISNCLACDGTEDAIGTGTDNNIIGNGLKKDLEILKEDMIVKQMLDVWMKHNQNYQYEEITDYPALLNLAYKIAKTKNWTKDDVMKTKLPDCLVSWEKIVLFIKQHDFYKQLEIKMIEKKWAGLYQTMDAYKDGSKKVEEKDPKKIKISL